MEANKERPVSSLTEVAFEARFPVLFAIPKKINEFQEKIISEFDKAEMRTEHSLTLLPNRDAQIEPQTVWQFTHNDGDPVIKIFMDKLVLFTHNYQNYRSGEGWSYRDFITNSVNNFLEIYKIPRFSRLGLRYINAFPISYDKEYFLGYFNPLYALDRYPLENTLESRFILRVRKEHSNITIQGGFSPGTPLNYVLDLDAYLENCYAKDCINILDTLHDTIKEEFTALTTVDLRKSLGIE